MSSAKDPSNDRRTEITAVIDGFIAQHGGVPGILRHLEVQGLGKTAETWVRKGPNLPISGDHVQALFGTDVVLSLAAQLRVQPQELACMIAQVLPQAVDQLTPNGVVIAPGAKP